MESTKENDLKSAPMEENINVSAFPWLRLNTSWIMKVDSASWV